MSRLQSVPIKSGKEFSLSAYVEFGQALVADVHETSFLDASTSRILA